MREEVLFTWAFDSEDLPAEHGGPLRVVTPHKYAYKGAKWVDGVEFLTEPERGYWEKRGYSNTADPGQKTGTAGPSRKEQAISRSALNVAQ